jgi:hypothetical protein
VENGFLLAFLKKGEEDKNLTQSHKVSWRPSCAVKKGFSNEKKDKKDKKEIFRIYSRG